eukprot:940394-Pelagomonas_calceolata.AAC.2
MAGVKAIVQQTISNFQGCDNVQCVSRCIVKLGGQFASLLWIGFFKEEQIGALIVYKGALEGRFLRGGVAGVQPKALT